MTYYLAVTLGVLMCLGILFGIFVYSLTLALNTKDTNKIDPIESSSSPNTND